jgi:hypothetical protein
VFNASGDLDDDVDSSEEVTCHGCSQNTVVLSDSSSKEDEAATANQPSGGDATASSSRDLEEEERQARLEAERHSKFNTECSSQRPEAVAPMAKGRLVRPWHFRPKLLQSLTRGAGLSVTPCEYHLHWFKHFTYLLPNLPSIFPF